MVKPELVIFDCDGVLVDSEPLSARAYAEVFQRHNVVIEPELMQRCVGMKQADILDLIHNAKGFRLPVEEVGDIWTETKSLIAAGLNPTPGMVAFLNGLDTRRCVASSSSLERIHHSLRVAGLSHFFDPDFVFSSSMVKRGKPEPDLFLFAAAQCGVAPAKCMVVEDSQYGVRGAKAAGMRVIGFMGGGHVTPALAPALKGAGADAVCHDWTEVAGFVV